MQGHVYHWRHGWIPLTHYAALQKAHGSHKGAAKYLDKSGGMHGTESHLHGGSHEVTKADAFGDGRVDEVRLPSGHKITVERATGRVSTGIYGEDSKGRTALAANPHLFEFRAVGTSIAHDDHHVLKNYEPGQRDAAHKAARDVIARPAVNRENLNVALRRGHMTDAQARDVIAKDAAERKAAREAVAQHVSGSDTRWQRLMNGNKIRQTNEGLVVTDGERTVHIEGTSVAAMNEARRLASGDVRNLFHVGRKKPGGDPWTSHIKLNANGTYTGPRAGFLPRR